MENAASDMLSNSILVVAHPDDEVLWFSSILDKVDEILFCFNDYPALPALGKGREKVLADYPLPNTSSLKIEESGSFSGADWENPSVSSYGMEIIHGKKIKRRYQDNFYLLRQRLEKHLQSRDNVITHNPWGEYGHEDHVQVYRAIESLKKKLSFRLWCSNYASNRSISLMFRYFSGFNTPYQMFSTNPELTTSLIDLYRKHNCWTWYGDFQWFDTECFLEAAHFPHDEEKHGRLFPINMLKTDFPDRPWQPPGKFTTMKTQLRRRLTRYLS